MAKQKFLAKQLFDGFNMQPPNTVLVTDEAGVIESMLPIEQAGDDIRELDGILTPGLINCHCHLELSHLKNVIPPHTGLVDFLCGVVTKRGFEASLIQQEIEKAESEMYENGIVAVGDIGNTADTIPVKAHSRIRWHNFIEVLSFTDAKASENIKTYQQVLDRFQHELPAPHRSVLTPHAPYSISPQTFVQLNAATRHQIISMHNQENPAEDELYETGQGGLLKLFRIFGVQQSPFPITGKTSLQSWLPSFNNGQTIFLVHNTFMTGADIDFADAYAVENELSLVYCFCPNANLYIENRVPDVEAFMQRGCHIVLGTDSYSSNWQLSIVKEIAVIHQHFPLLPVETILQWATSNGAKALKWEDELGSFKKGMRPGLTVLSEDLQTSYRLL